MKKRVTTIHGKVIVSGGENPENELKNHEILLKEESDGTVDIKERNINGEVVSIAGGGSGNNGSAISIPFYYSKGTYLNLKDDMVEGIITFEGTVPTYIGAALDPATGTYVKNLPYWRGNSWVDKTNTIDAYLSCSEWEFGGKMLVSNIEIEVALSRYPSKEEQRAFIAEELSGYRKDINFMYYAQGTGFLSTSLSRLFTPVPLRGSADNYFADLGTLYHYDHASNTIQEICSASYLKGLMLTMHEETNNE